MFNSCNIRVGKREKFHSKYQEKTTIDENGLNFEYKSNVLINKLDLSLWLYYCPPQFEIFMWQHFSVHSNCIKNSIKQWLTQKYWCWKRGENVFLWLGLWLEKCGFKRLISHLKSRRTLYNSISFNCIQSISCYWIWSTWMKRDFRYDFLFISFKFMYTS